MRRYANPIHNSKNSLRIVRMNVLSAVMHNETACHLSLSRVSINERHYFSVSMR